MDVDGYTQPCGETSGTQNSEQGLNAGNGVRVWNILDIPLDGTVIHAPSTVRCVFRIIIIATHC